MPHFAHPYHSDKRSQRRRASPWRQQPLLLNCTLQWWGVVTLLLPGLVRSGPTFMVDLTCPWKNRWQWNVLSRVTENAGNETWDIPPTLDRGCFVFVLVMLPVFGYRPLWNPEVKMERPIILKNNSQLEIQNHETHLRYTCISLQVSCCVKNRKGINLEHKEMEIN
jgi:hypothetical protein